jgi:hypothetical protein
LSQWILRAEAECHGLGLRPLPAATCGRLRPWCNRWLRLSLLRAPKTETLADRLRAQCRRRILQSARPLRLQPKERLKGKESACLRGPPRGHSGERVRSTVPSTSGSTAPNANQNIKFNFVWPYQTYGCLFSGYQSAVSGSSMLSTIYLQDKRKMRFICLWSDASLSISPLIKSRACEGDLARFPMAARIDD